MAQVSKTIAEKLKEWENSSVDDIAVGASPSPVYNPIAVVVFGVVEIQQEHSSGKVVPKISSAGILVKNYKSQRASGPKG